MQAECKCRLWTRRSVLRIEYFVLEFTANAMEITLSKLDPHSPPNGRGLYLYLYKARNVLPLEVQNLAERATQSHNPESSKNRDWHASHSSWVTRKLPQELVQQ